MTYTGFGWDLKWSTKMFDASAKLPKTGMLKGRRHFPGNMDSCLETKAEAMFTGKAGIEPNLRVGSEEIQQPQVNIACFA